MKKIIAVCATVAVLISSFCSLNVFAAQVNQDKPEFEYRVINDGTAEITRYSGNAKR